MIVPSEPEIREHLERFCPPVGSEPHVWVAPISASCTDTEQWLDIGPLEAVCKKYPDVADIISSWLPMPKLGLAGTLNLTATLRCQVAVIGDPDRG